MSRIQAPRGTHDVLPGDDAWWHVVQTMEKVVRLYGWRRIQTPGFEDTCCIAPPHSACHVAPSR